MSLITHIQPGDFREAMNQKEFPGALCRSLIDLYNRYKTWDGTDDNKSFARTYKMSQAMNSALTHCIVVGAWVRFGADEILQYFRAFEVPVHRFDECWEGLTLLSDAGIVEHHPDPPDAGDWTFTKDGIKAVSASLLAGCK